MTTPSGFESTPTSIRVGSDRVSGLLIAPPDSWVLYVLAHGAGAGMRHSFLERIAQELARRGVATLRYQFPYMDVGKSRTDSPAVAAATTRAAVIEAARVRPGLPLLAGGKSFGGRMTSTAAADSALPGVVGLVFLGFPLHPPGKPSISRADHLDRVEVPLLFLQGTRDEFAELDLVREVTGRLGSRATLELIEGANHSFDAPKKTGQTKDSILSHLAELTSAWARRQL